jgi:DNA repair protein RadD
VKVKLKLRPYQAAAFQHILAYYQEHHEQPKSGMLAVLPPGGGKTPIAAAVLRAFATRGLRGLACANRRELVGQMYNHLVHSGIPASMLGVVMAGDRRANPDAPIQVASVDTLRHRDKPPADILVKDEAHHDASDGQRALAAFYPHAFRLGFTATPQRMDGRGLAADYDDMYIIAQPSELIADGYLAAPSVFTVPADLLPDLRGTRIARGDYAQGDLEQRANKKQLLGSIVDHWLRRANNRPTMAFPVSIKHSLSIVDRFMRAGIQAAHLDGDVNIATRADILEKLADGRIRVVSSCGVLSEGVDVPAVKCVIMARPTLSLVLATQQGGRCMRPWKGMKPLILDHAGNVVVHGPPHMDRPWDFADIPRRGGRRKTSRICQSCFEVIEAGNQCSCGKSSWSDDEPEEANGELQAYSALVPPDVKRAELDRLVNFARGKGFTEEWAHKVYRAKFGERAGASGGGEAHASV